MDVLVTDLGVEYGKGNRPMKRVGGTLNQHGEYTFDRKHGTYHFHHDDLYRIVYIRYSIGDQARRWRHQIDSTMKFKVRAGVSRRGFLGMFAAACLLPYIEAGPLAIVAPSGRFFLEGGKWHRIEMRFPMLKTVGRLLVDAENCKLTSMVDDVHVHGHNIPIGRRMEVGTLGSAAVGSMGFSICTENDVDGAALVPGGLVFRSRKHDHPKLVYDAFGTAIEVRVNGKAIKLEDLM